MTSNQGKILAIIFFAVITAGAIFLGLQFISNWHEQEINSALELQRKQFEKSHAELEHDLHQVEKQLDMERQVTVIPEERAAEVFGTPVGTDYEEIVMLDQCSLVKERIDSFFIYLDKKKGASDKSSREIFFSMMDELAENPPLVVGETRDLITLLRNRAHFFRVLKKDRIDLVRNVLKTEKDILESAMEDFYAYYLAEDACVKEDEDQLMTIPALYDYAGFFLETISGKSYLMRRSSVTRSLAAYYSVILLDQAIEEGLNKYGIDIREHIALAKNDIQNQGGMANRDQYMKRLGELERKYH